MSPSFDECSVTKTSKDGVERGSPLAPSALGLEGAIEVIRLSQ